MNWQSTMSLDALRDRALFLKTLRRFFDDRGAIEIDVPVIGRLAGTDPHLQPITITDGDFHGSLQTSPEFFLKRLLAQGVGDCYYLGKAFRSDEQGRRHQPEFTMLEWYRVGWTMPQLMQEVSELIRQFVSVAGQEELSYQQWFLRYTDLDPFVVETKVLSQWCQVNLGFCDDNRDVLLDAMTSLFLEQQLPKDQLTFIVDYPPSQAALARTMLQEQGHLVAKRFEVYLGGLELANGYWELTDVQEQAERFNHDTQVREQLGYCAIEQDEKFLAALAAGLPECSGVALGVDRLLMLKRGAAHIEEVVPFTREQL